MAASTAGTESGEGVQEMMEGERPDRSVRCPNGGQACCDHGGGGDAAVVEIFDAVIMWEGDPDGLAGRGGRLV